MTTTLTRAAYAAHRLAQGLRGTTARSVGRALASGRIHAEAGGGIDPTRADREWAATTRLRADAPARLHPCHAVMRELIGRLVRIERCHDAVLEETVKHGPDDYHTKAWPALDQEWEKMADALERLDRELTAAIPLEGLADNAGRPARRYQST